MTPHEAANTPGNRLRPGDIEPAEWAAAAKILAKLGDDDFAEAMRFDRSIWGA